jgi:HlyD family secretion protein
MSRRLKIGCGVFIFVMVAGIVVPLKFLRAKPIEVDVAAVERADIRESVSAVPVAGQPAGVVKPDEVKVIPKVGGELVGLLVEEGDRVKQGQVLAYLDPKPLGFQLTQARETAASARARSAQAQATLQVTPTRSKASLIEATAALDKAVASYKTALRGARAEEIERSRQSVVQAERDLDDAEASLATVRRGARAEEIAASEAAFKQAQAQAESSRASRDLIHAGPRQEEVAQAEASLADAQAQVDLRKVELDSQQRLLDKGFIARNAFKAAQTAYQSAVAGRDAAGQRLSIAKQPHRPQEIEQADAAYAAALASVERSAQDLALAHNRSTPQEIASATARRDAAQARLLSARADLKLTQSRTTPEDLRAADATVRQAQAGLSRAEADQVSVREQQFSAASLQADLRRSESALAQAADQAGYAVVHAPVSGVVTRLNVKKGEYVQGGGIALPSADIAMLVVTSDTIWVDCNIDEADVSRVTETQEATIYLSDAVELTGKVHHVSPSVRLTQGDVRTFSVEIGLNKGAAKLRSGMSVDVDIIVKATKNALSVPSFAVLEDKDGSQYVYVLENGRAKKRKVTKGVAGVERVEITEGLAEGEQVITSLEDKGLRDNKRVKIREKTGDEKPKPTGGEKGNAEAGNAEAQGAAPPSTGAMLSALPRDGRCRHERL